MQNPRYYGRFISDPNENESHTHARADTHVHTRTHMIKI